MQSNGRTFNLELKKWAGDFAGDMDALARQTCLTISENVVKSTPVDTGFLRGSWQPSLNAPVVGEGVATIGAVASQVKAGDIYWMTNGAQYAPFVEFGTSRMAGRFYVTDNMKKAPSVVSKLAKELGS